MLFGHHSWCWSWSVILFFMYWTWSSVLWRLELELKITKVVESKKANFCDLCLDIFDADSNKWHAVFFNVVHCILKSHSRISYASLFARASNFSIHPLPRERKLKRNHVAARLANHLYGNLTFGVGSRAHNWLQSTQSAWRCQHGMCNWPQTLTGYASSQTTRWLTSLLATSDAFDANVLIKP